MVHFHICFSSFICTVSWIPAPVGQELCGFYCMRLWSAQDANCVITNGSELSENISRK